MANRSTFNATLPRDIKRFLALQSTGDAHHDGEVRRLFIAAHARLKHVVKKRLTQGGAIIGTDVEETPVLAEVK